MIPDDAVPKRPEELPGDLRLLAEIIAREIGCEQTGARCAFAVAIEFAGVNLYVNGMREWWRDWRDRQIRAIFDRRIAAGNTAVAVVRDMAMTDWPGTGRISERTVWEILGRPDDRQMRLF